MLSKYFPPILIGCGSFYLMCKSLNNRAIEGTRSAPKNQADQVDKNFSDRDNRSELGGLRGSSDEGIPPSLPRFQISGNYPEKPDFMTPPPPYPDLSALRSSQSAEREVAAKQWLEAIQEYIYDGMNNQDPIDKNMNFRTGIPGNLISENRWYHMPWLHTPASASDAGRGREGVWGLTRELDLLGPIHAHEWPVVNGSDCIAQNWGIGIFNEPGGYAIGRVFPPGTEENLVNFQFPKGTVSAKLLFTSALPENLPVVDGAMTIDAWINGNGTCKGARNKRRQTTMRHIQMDVMMRWGDGVDDWIFGVFVYNKANIGDYWQGMTPLGVQFGVKRDETVKASEMQPNGYDGRLNGPADNPLSSCMSCHARAQWPEVSLQRLPFAPDGLEDRGNICLLHDWGGEEVCKSRSCDSGNCIPPGRSPLIPGFHSTDYALQISLGLRNKIR